MSGNYRSRVAKELTSLIVSSVTFADLLLSTYNAASYLTYLISTWLGLALPLVLYKLHAWYFFLFQH